LLIEQEDGPIDTTSPDLFSIDLFSIDLFSIDLFSIKSPANPRIKH